MKLTAKEYCYIDSSYRPSYVVEVFRKGRRVAVVKRHELTTLETIKREWIDHAPVVREGKLYISDNYGYEYRMLYDCGYANIVDNYNTYKALKAQLEREHPEVVMTTKDGEKRYEYNFQIKYARG